MKQDLLARELVPGDIVEISLGDRVPADIRILQVMLSIWRYKDQDYWWQLLDSLSDL